jgi:hypothetical protein
MVHFPFGNPQMVSSSIATECFIIHHLLCKAPISCQVQRAPHGLILILFFDDIRWNLKTKKKLFYPSKPTNQNIKTMTTIIISFRTLKPNKTIHYIILKLPNPQATIHCEHLGI